MLGVLTVFGLLASGVGHQQRLVVLRHPLVDTFPAAAQGAVGQIVFESADHLGAVALLSVIGLVWFSTGVFSTGFPLYAHLAATLAAKAVFSPRSSGSSRVYFIAQAVLEGAAFNRMRLDARQGQNGYPGNATAL